MENQQVLIDRLPSGKLQVSDYRLKDSAMPEIRDDEVLIKTQAFAITAGTRAGLQGSASYAGAPAAGRVMNGTGIGEVVASNVHKIKVGDRVTAPTGWQQYAALNADQVTVIAADHDPIHYLGPMGVNGLTAYFGLLDVGKPKPRETVMVSAAAGSVGHMVGQMAKIQGCEVVGVCGSDEKGRLLVEQLGFDRTVNYKDANYRQSLKEATPDGVDVYFDNTGGMILGSALFRMNVAGRITTQSAPCRPIMGKTIRHASTSKTSDLRIVRWISARRRHSDHVFSWAKATGFQTTLCAIFET